MAAGIERSLRRRDWQERLATYLHQRMATPFAWGSHDCCTFAAGAVEAMTGSNPMAVLPRYDTEHAALRIIVEGGDLRRLVSSILGEPVRPAFAAMGDVVLLSNEGRELLGICNGVNAIAASQDGVAALEMSAAIEAWKI